MPEARPPILRGSWQPWLQPVQVSPEHTLHPAGSHCPPERAGICPAHSPTKILAGSGIPQPGAGGARNPLLAAPSALRYQLGLRALGSSGLGALQGPRSGLPQVMGRGLGWS